MGILSGSVGDRNTAEIKIKRHELFHVLRNKVFHKLTQFKCADVVLQHIYDKFDATEFSESIQKQ